MQFFFCCCSGRKHFPNKFEDCCWAGSSCSDKNARSFRLRRPYCAGSKLCLGLHLKKKLDVSITQLLSDLCSYIVFIFKLLSFIFEEPSSFPSFWKLFQWVYLRLYSILKLYIKHNNSEFYKKLFDFEIKLHYFEQKKFLKIFLKNQICVFFYVFGISNNSKFSLF